MTSVKRIQGLTVAAAVLSAGALVAGPAATSSAAPADQTKISSERTSTTDASTATKSSATRAKKYKCRLGLSFKPRAGKGNKKIRSGGHVRCNKKVKRIYTSVRLIQSKAPNKYKITNRKRTKRNNTVMKTFCPREYRTYKVVVKATVKLPKSANKNQLKLKKSGRQSGTCR